jgi:hypothetical protein
MNSELDSIIDATARLEVKGAKVGMFFAATFRLPLGWRTEPRSLCSGNRFRPFVAQTFASRAALWCNALTSDEGLGLITPQDANRSGLRH